ncbi:MAG: response regulator [Lachnospiraceae bacterium]|nr:response regulator [Lachnospiraceae bacterium]
MNSRMKIMVVDDNTVNLATLEQELSDKYDIIPMLTGRRAIKYLYRETCDMILLDVQMPIMDGIETLREIRTQENGVDVPVIFLTARRDSQTVLEGSKLGIVDFITKPFDADNLRMRIDNVFKKLGILPLENEELLDRINDIYNRLLDLDEEGVMKEIDEMLQFKMDEDILGRLHNVKHKLEQGNVDGAIEMTERIRDMLDHIMDNGDGGNLIPISMGEIITALNATLEDLEEFKTKEAVERLKNLKGCDVPSDVRRNLKEAMKYLKNYDDIEAKKVIENMIMFVRENEDSEKQDSRGGGYHSSRLT